MGKRFLTLLGVICLVTACRSSSTFKVSGTLSGVESDTLLVVSFPVGNPSERQMDTVAMQNGKFEFNLEDSVLRQVNLFAKPAFRSDLKGAVPAMSMKSVSCLLLPGQPITINGSFEDYTVSGGTFYADNNEVKSSYKVYSDKIDSLIRVGREMTKAGVLEDSLRRVYAPIQEWQEAICQIQCDYVGKNTQKDVSVYILSQLPYDESGKLLELLSDQVKNGVMAPLYQSVKANYERTLARKEAEELIKEGAPAPQFTLKDITGKEFSLSSLKGKYVILDFWGSWCGWCIKGFPEMKKAYEKYKGKVEFVGIDCNDTEQKWKAAVAEHQLPWINVRTENDPNVSVMYAVGGFPTKFVIDPKGNILKKVIGEDPAFYTFLDDTIR